jgi:hypothetical protein
MTFLKYHSELSSNTIYARLQIKHANRLLLLIVQDGAPMKMH